MKGKTFLILFLISKKENECSHLAKPQNEKGEREERMREFQRFGFKLTFYGQLNKHKHTHMWT